MTTQRKTTYAIVITLAMIALAGALVGCETPNAGETATLGEETAPLLDAQADAMAAKGDTAAAERWRTMAAKLRSATETIRAKIADGTIEPTATLDEVAPFLDSDEARVISLLLGLAGRAGDGSMTFDAVLGGLQTALPIVLPSWGVLGVGILGLARKWMRQRRATDRIVHGVDRMRESGAIDWAAARDEMRSALGDDVSRIVAGSKRRRARANRRRSARNAEKLADAKAIIDDVGGEPS